MLRNSSHLSYSALKKKKKSKAEFHDQKYWVDAETQIPSHRFTEHANLVKEPRNPIIYLTR